MTELTNDPLYRRLCNKGGQIVINPRHPGTLHCITDEHDPHIAEYKRALDEIARMGEHLAGWVLTGGFAIPATLGQFYRRHRAIHLGVESAALPALLNAVSEQGYYPFARTQMKRISETQKRDIYIPLTPEEIQKLSRLEKLESTMMGLGDKSENIRLIKMFSEIITPHEDLLSYLDLYIHRDQGDKLLSNDDKPRPLQRYFEGESYHTSNGRALHIVNLSYLKTIKKERYEKNRRSWVKNRKERSKTDQYDLQKIAEYEQRPHTSPVI